MATNYRHSGDRVPVATASGTIVSGALCRQEGFFGIAMTSEVSGGSLWLKIQGVFNIAVPASTVKGDPLYTSASGDSVALTLTRTQAGANPLCIGMAMSDRDAAGLALVLLAPQPAATGADTELITLGANIPQAAEADLAGTNLSATVGGVPLTGVAATSLDTAVGEIETRLDNIESKANALLAKLRTAGIITP